MVLIDLRFSRRDASLLLALFLLQFPFPETGVRLTFSAAYIVAAIWVGVRHRRAIRPAFATALHPGRSAGGAPEPGSEPIELAVTSTDAQH